MSAIVRGTRAWVLQFTPCALAEAIMGTGWPLPLWRCIHAERRTR